MSEQTDINEDVTRLASNVVNRIEELTAVKTAKDVIETYRGTDLAEDFKYGKLLDASAFQTVSNIMSKQQDELTDDDYLSFSTANDKLLQLQYTAQKKIDAILADRKQPEDRPTTNNAYRNIVGMNVPVSSSINDYEQLSDSYAKHNAELQAVSETGVRGYEHKNWVQSCLNKDSVMSGGHAAYQTWDEDRQKLAQDLDLKNASNYLYTPQKLSNEAYRQYHKSLPNVDSHLQQNTDHSLAAHNNAMQEIRGHIDNAMQYEHSDLISCY